MVSLPDGRVVDAIIGYRSWIATPDYGVAHLESVYESIGWPRHRALESQCVCASRQIMRMSNIFSFDVDITHTCGIYAWNDPARDYVAQKRLIHADWPRLHKFVVSGEVALWGEVILHEHGYRAEFARPHALYAADPEVGGGTHKIAVELAALTYDVPLVMKGGD